MSFAHFDPDFSLCGQGAAEPCAVLLAEMRALREQALGGAAVSHRLRKVLLAGGARPVSRREAEILCEIAEGSAEGQSEAFAPLYAAALANHVLAAGAASPEAPCLDRRLWLDLGMLARVAGGQGIDALCASALTAALCEESPCDVAGWSARAASDAMLTEIAQAGALAESWLAQRLRGRRSHVRAEKTLLAVLAPCVDVRACEPAAKAA